MNKGLIFNETGLKYQKTGLKPEERKRILFQLEELISEEKIYRSGTLSLSVLAKQIKTTTHALSQVINENYNKTYFELISEERITEAKKLLLNNPSQKVSEIAFKVGYNSIFLLYLC